MDILLHMALPLLGAGLFAGFLGGLFGIGGGVVIVPALYAVFGSIGVPEETRIKLAVGTSLATIIVTSFRSLSTHNKHGAVDKALLANWWPMISAGAVAGAVIARFIRADSLTLIFAIGIAAVAVQKMRPVKSGSDKISAGTNPAGFAPLPSNKIRLPVAFGIGTVSSLLGIGGGVVGVITLTSLGRTIHQAIATAAGFGFAIAVPGALGFMLAGQGALGLPFGSIGFVSIPAFLLIATMTAFSAPIGARAAHRLDKTTLNRVFAAYLLGTALLMLRAALV